MDLEDILAAQVRGKDLHGVKDDAYVRAMTCKIFFAGCCLSAT